MHPTLQCGIRTDVPTSELIEYLCYVYHQLVIYIVSRKGRRHGLLLITMVRLYEKSCNSVFFQLTQNVANTSCYVHQKVEHYCATLILNVTTIVAQ